MRAKALFRSIQSNTLCWTCTIRQKSSAVLKPIMGVTSRQPWQRIPQISWSQLLSKFCSNDQQSSAISSHATDGHGIPSLTRLHWHCVFAAAQITQTAETSPPILRARVHPQPIRVQAAVSLYHVVSLYQSTFFEAWYSLVMPGRTNGLQSSGATSYSSIDILGSLPHCWADHTPPKHPPGLELPAKQTNMTDMNVYIPLS